MGVVKEVKQSLPDLISLETICKAKNLAFSDAEREPSSQSQVYLTMIRNAHRPHNEVTYIQRPAKVFALQIVSREVRSGKDCLTSVPYSHHITPVIPL
jgi:hypothetical protein